MNVKKFALIHLGNDEAYGLIFVAGELINKGHKINWFDGDSGDFIKEVIEWNPDFICFSPLTELFTRAVELSKKIKKRLPKTRSLFGGHHVFAVPESIKLAGVDIVVAGSVYGTIEKITESKHKEIIHGILTPVEKMVPTRKEYYDAIPRIASRHRKLIMSHFGCVYSCSYCSTSRVRRFYGHLAYQRYCLTRRPIANLIKEAKAFLEYPTKEVSIEDDDILSGDNAEQWLGDFTLAWKGEIGLPASANVSPVTVIKTSDKALSILSGLVSSVQMGVQVVKEESLRLFNRLAHNEKIVKTAYDRLQSFGIPVKMEFIMGLPVSDPVGDAIESIKMAQRLGSNVYITAFPLMIYPGTDLYLWCKKNKIKMNKECTMEWYTGVGSIEFDALTVKRIKNLIKMATMFVKYNIDERWIRALIDVDLSETASQELAKCKYLEGIIFRLGKNAASNFEEILSGMHLKY